MCVTEMPYIVVSLSDVAYFSCQGCHPSKKFHLIYFHSIFFKYWGCLFTDQQLGWGAIHKKKSRDTSRLKHINTMRHSDHTCFLFSILLHRQNQMSRWGGYGRASMAPLFICKKTLHIWLAVMSEHVCVLVPLNASVFGEREGERRSIWVKGCKPVLLCWY